MLLCCQISVYSSSRLHLIQNQYTSTKSEEMKYHDNTTRETNTVWELHELVLLLHLPRKTLQQSR